MIRRAAGRSARARAGRGPGPQRGRVRSRVRWRQHGRDDPCQPRGVPANSAWCRASCATSRSIELSCRILEEVLPAPVLLAPVGGQALIQADGELASARAAAALGIPVIASTRSSFTPERIAEAAGTGSRWFQLYWPADDEILKSFVRRVERAGYSAIVVTVDCFAMGWRPLDMTLAGPLDVQGVGSQIFFSDPAFRANLSRPPEEDPAAADVLYHRLRSHPALNWDDLDRLRELTSLPIVREGASAPRRRPRGGLTRGCGDRLLQPWRPPGRRRDRLARCIAGDRRRRR